MEHVILPTNQMETEGSNSGSGTLSVVVVSKPDMEEKRRLAREWLDSCGLRYRVSINNNSNERRDNRENDSSFELNEHHIESTAVALCIRGGATESYYQSIYARELESDRALVASICPLFVLHGLAAMLCQGDVIGDVTQQQSREWMLVLHCVKVKLAQQQQPIAIATPVIPFLVRLFDLVYQHRAWVPERPERQALCNVVACFLCESLQFLVVKANRSTYAYACPSIADQRAMEIIVASNMDRLYQRQQRYTGGAGDEFKEFLAVSHGIARCVLRTALDGWAQFQKGRYGCQEAPLCIVTIKTTLYADEMTVSCK